MNQIRPHHIWIGHAGDCRSTREIVALGIEAVVQLAAEEQASAELPRELIAFRFPLVDGADNEPALLDLAIGVTAALISYRVPILVCCGGGMSRSPAIVAAAIAAAEQLDLEESIRRVAACHPADVSAALWKQVAAVSRERRLYFRRA
jgi:protein-tyrosine phosphatase